MQSVLDAPVAAHRVGETTGRDELAQDVIAVFTDLLTVALSFVDSNSNRLQTNPTRTVWQVFGNGTDHVVTSFLPAVPFFVSHVVTHPDAREVVLHVLLEEVDDPLMQCWLVILDGQAIIRARADDLPRDLGLTTHRVDGDHRTRQFEHFQQLGNGRDLVAFGVDDDLSQANVIRGRPGAHHVNGRLAVSHVEAAAERPPVDGDYLPIGDFVQGRDPTQQTLLELRRLDRGEDRIETIMRRDTTLQVQKSCQPLPLGCPKSGDGDEIIRATNHRANCNDHHIDQRIYHLTTPRI